MKIYQGFLYKYFLQKNIPNVSPGTTQFFNKILLPESV